MCVYICVCVLMMMLMMLVKSLCYAARHNELNEVGWFFLVL